MLEDQYIGVALAVCGSFLIGSSYVTTKIGLRDARERNGFKGDGFEYFKNPLWWTGMIMVCILRIALVICTLNESRVVSDIARSSDTFKSS
jgi:hypothetical protein